MGGADVADYFDAEDEGRGCGEIVLCDKGDVDGVDFAFARRDGRGISGEGDGVSCGDGGAWEVQAGVSAMWECDSTD